MNQYFLNRITVRMKMIIVGMLLGCGMATTSHAQIKQGETITRTLTDTIQVTDHKEPSDHQSLLEQLVCDGRCRCQCLLG